MAAYYFDTSALVKRYVQERGSRWVRGILRPSSGQVVHVSRLLGPELASALVRRERSGQLSTSARRRGLRHFNRNAGSRLRVSEVGPATATMAMSLVEQYGIRGFDAVHLSVALELNAQRIEAGLGQVTFVSADRDQLAAAAREGLAVEDPNTRA